jgi:alpha-galactosidase
MQVDAGTGIIAGTAPEKPGRFVLTFQASNAHGNATRKFSLMVGNTLALTPPMGWNSWYIHFSSVSEKAMRAAADAMIASGMADVGYMYVNIDDCWMKRRDETPYRDAAGTILCNDRFPDIRGMVEYIHSKGLRAGIYTSPGPWTCGRYVGSYQHEEQDARTFAAWGFDFLKYDWCSYSEIYKERVKTSGNDLLEKQRPYQQMGDILKKLDRDVVFNLCQYGMNDVWTWGDKVGGHCWRTTGDVGWAKDTNLPGFYSIGFSNAQHWKHAKPGAWNDPDYLVIGMIGDHAKYVAQLRAGEIPKIEFLPTPLTPDEQYSYMSMWCLMAAPLFFSSDMAQLDAFTLGVLCNPEVIEVDQDVLGKQAAPVRHTDSDLILAKPMEDGSLAVGLFNLGETPRPMTATWQDLGLAGKLRVRDLWRQKDLGSFEDRFTVQVNRHGVSLLRLYPAE